MNSLEESMVSGIPDGSNGDHLVNGLDVTYVTPRIIAMDFHKNQTRLRDVQTKSNN